MTICNLDPHALAALLADGRALVIDVREDYEFIAGRIAGAVHFPLSRFSPAGLPDPGAQTVVFVCAAGVRSARAVALCEEVGLPYNTHLAGGMAAWGDVGFPVECGPQQMRGN